MGGCRRRAVLPGLLGTGMATGVSSAGVRRLAGSGVQGPDDVGRIGPAMAWRLSFMVGVT